MNVDENYPQFIKIDAKIKENFLEPLINNVSGIFYKRDFGEVYFMAVVLGFKNKVRKKTEKNEDLRLYQTLQDKYKLLIRAIVLSETQYNYDILNDGRQVLKIVEEFANGGASLLYDKIFKGGSNISIEDELWNQIKNQELSK